MATKSAAKTKKQNNTTRFFKGVWSELKKVHWPNRKELITYTSVVVTSVLLVSLLIWVVDSVFSAILNKVL